MSARRLDGKAPAERRRAQLADEVRAVRTIIGRAPRLVVVLATEDAAALAYAAAKGRAAHALGIDVDVVRIERPTTAGLVEYVRALGLDDGVDGILVETPIAPEVDLRAVQDAIPVDKDVDGASTLSLGRLFCGAPGFVPATAGAVMALLEEHAVELSGRRVAVVGRSLVVGRPLGQLLLARDATVTICHSRTRDLAATTREADIVCVAVGKPRFVTAAMVKPGAVVVDVGTNMVDGKLVGDVDFDSVAAVAGALSSVPGGVGPLTTVVVLENTARAARQQAERVSR
ncbi:MAG: bifunctional 5,10-methylenetetrahydrofolate dehydrogenase/5,10-methenyltetrahydrofolate cyclohydrolase [Candidatus Bipolaricaulota bacterium]|nr:bifunctional 5,10-methylenetetrahydrofolate dehydrogenase/5,10-methenyltetrahydrofolate cyclohydrolase [Candidatus Bipolaricaulota bacterium]